MTFDKIILSIVFDLLSVEGKSAMRIHHNVTRFQALVMAY